MLPEIFVFGDSFVDIGNNNDLPLSLAKANFLHNGIDFPSQKATGRFSNGKNIDLLAEKVGCQVHRLTFLSTQTQQVEYYLKVHEHLTKRLGSAHAQKHLSKSLFFIVFGSNNILDYSRSIDQNKPPKMHVNQMTTLLKAKLKRIQNETRGCREDTNTWTVMYKEALESMSQELKSEVKDMSYSYSHTYPLIHGFIQDPASNGSRRCIDNVFDGPPEYTSPVNVRQLIAL
ncbi:hypothetical protein CRG98_002148 [Punica granatum]|uniref:GDSL esterase/lipase At5g55050-like n=1 Tax=Punica granatum TaxID=22663 RepID=A0A2I0LA30_PUNGR|nr:hypothetical protein CRG98_002148 [Punica granatum]